VTEVSASVMRGAGPIVDPAVLEALRGLPFRQFFTDADPRAMDPAILPRYLETFTEWIGHSHLNDVRGLSSFPFRKLTAGITQSFDDFFLRHHGRRIRILRGEYPYAKRVCTNWAFADDLAPGDALIISAPFSGTGGMHEEFVALLDCAVQRGVPVLVDCAFFGICRNLRVDLSHPSIESACFSLSKAFASGSFRAGIEFCRHNEGAAAAQNEWCYVPLLAAQIGVLLMEQFSPDYIFTKHRATQEAICRELDLQPTDTIIIGLGGEQYREYSIDAVVNRCCITPIFQQRIRAAAALPLASK
jgi:hypothetical protein